MSPSACPSCSSKGWSKFNGELALHFPGLRGLDKPPVWAFPEVLVCLNCGFTVCTLKDDALKEAQQVYADDGSSGMGDVARAG
jgi:hypothetical protein